MSIQSELNRINTAKNDIISSIISKGVDVPEGTSISSLSGYINQINTGFKYESKNFNVISSNWVSDESSNYLYKNLLGTIDEEVSDIVSVFPIYDDSSNIGVSDNEIAIYFKWKTIKVENKNIYMYSNESISNNFNVIITFLLK